MENKSQKNSAQDKKKWESPNLEKLGDFKDTEGKFIPALPEGTTGTIGGETVTTGS